MKYEFKIRTVVTICVVCLWQCIAVKSAMNTQLPEVGFDLWSGMLSQQPVSCIAVSELQLSVLIDRLVSWLPQ